MSNSSCPRGVRWHGTTAWEHAAQTTEPHGRKKINIWCLSQTLREEQRKAKNREAQRLSRKKRAGTHSRRHDEDQACDNALCAPLLGPITPSAEVIQHFVQLQDLDITVPANHADASVCEQQHTECPDPGLLSDIEIDVDYQGNFASDSHLSGTTALHIAAEAGHLGVVKMIVQCGIDASSRDGRARTALHLASRRGHDGIVSFLLEQGVEIDAPDFMGWTALHMAAAAGAETTVSRLIQSGSNIHARTTQN